MSILRALSGSVIGGVSSILVNFLTVVLASRYLQPADVGAYAVSFTFITVVSLLAEANAQNYIIKLINVDVEMISSIKGILWLHIIFFITVILIFLDEISYVLAGADSKKVSGIVILMLPILVAIPVASPELGILRGKMKYGPIMLSGVASSFSRLIFCFYLLQEGYGVLALVFSVIFSKIVEVFVVILFLPDYLILIPRFVGIKKMYSFLLPTTISQAAGTVGFAVSEIASGHYLGLHAAGLFNRANALTSIYRTAIERAVVPIYYANLAHLLSTSPREATKNYVTTQNIMSGVGWSVFGFLYVQAGSFVEIFFGPNWKDAVVAVKILSIACAIYILCAMTSSVLMALDEKRVMIFRELLIQSFRVIIVIWSTKYGIKGVATAVLFTYAMTALFDLITMQKFLKLKISDFFVSLLPSFFVSATVVLCVCVSEFFCEYFQISLNVGFAINLVVFFVLWVTCIFLFKHGAASYVMVVFQKIRK